MPVFDAGVIYESAMHARDPHGILKKIFKLYLERGGKFIQTNVKNLEQININETVIKSENEEYKFEKTVVASGAFSKKFTDKLGENIPWTLNEDTMYILSKKSICYQGQLYSWIEVLE